MKLKHKMKCIFAAKMKNKTLICIGSNHNKEANIALCQELLSSIFEDITFSDAITSEAYGDYYKLDFTNQLACVHCTESKTEVYQLLKDLELKMGRTADDRKEAIVRIDIDLIMWNDEVLKPEDMKRVYMKKMLASFDI